MGEGIFFKKFPSPSTLTPTLQNFYIGLLRTQKVFENQEKN